MSDDEQEPVGSVGEEAAKLLSAVQDWAKENGDQYAGAASEATAGASTVWNSLNEHLATGGEGCTYCPLCRMISAFRATSPDVKNHLAASVTSLGRALAAALETDVDSARSRRKDAGVEKIDLSEEPWHES